MTGELVYKGKLTSLKRFKDDAREVTNGMECGVGLNFTDIQVGDTVEAFVTEKGSRGVNRELVEPS